MAAIHPTGVTERKILHDSGKRNIGYLYGQMDMIAHQTKCMHTVTESFDSLLYKNKQVVSVFRAEENILAAIAAKHNMIKSTRNMNPCFTCHGGMIYVSENNSITHA